MTKSSRTRAAPAAPIIVNLGERTYPIYVDDGVLQQAGTLIAPKLKRPKTVIVTDENVAPLHLEDLVESLNDANVSTETIILPPGEQTKSYEHLQTLTERLLDLGVERSDAILAFGGGVIGDLTGFAASILRRGVGFIQIPTTLLSQVDSSVGGKTAINSPQGKNLIGSFYQPLMVLCDIGVLRTLPENEFKAGYAEVVKYGLICDSEFFDWLDSPATMVNTSSPMDVIQAVRRSCAIKADIVARDEREDNVRALLNFGHTFGHALEAITGYTPELLHGEAVSIGMALAAGFSEELGLCSSTDRERIEAHLETRRMKMSLADIPQTHLSVETLIHHMYQDKKVQDGRLTFILMKQIGETIIDKSVEESALVQFLTRKLDDVSRTHP